MGAKGPWAALSSRMWGWLLAADGEGSAWTCSNPCWASHVYLAWVPAGNARAGAGSGQQVGQDGLQVPACSPFPGQGNQHARQILSAWCAPPAPRPLLPGAPVNKLYNGHHGCLQNPDWLLGTACLGMLAQVPLGSPVLPVVCCPRVMLRAAGGPDAACHRGAPSSHSPAGQHPWG